MARICDWCGLEIIDQRTDRTPGTRCGHECGTPWRLEFHDRNTDVSTVVGWYSNHDYASAAAMDWNTHAENNAHPVEAMVFLDRSHAGR